MSLVSHSIFKPHPFCVQGYRNEDRKVAAPRRRTFCKNRAFKLAIFGVTRERNPRPRDQACPEEAQHAGAAVDLEARAKTLALEALAEARHALEAAARAAAMGALAERRIELETAARATASPVGAGGRPKPADSGLIDDEVWNGMSRAARKKLAATTKKNAWDLSEKAV